MADGTEQPARSEAPGVLLGVSLGLLAIVLLPNAGGGYSGAGYQLGFVILPIAAAIAHLSCRERPRAAVCVLALIAASFALTFLWLHPGRVLWYYLLDIAAAWAVVWTLMREAPSRASWLLPGICISALLTAAFGWWLWLGAGEMGFQITSTFGLHNAYAAFLLLAWPVCLLGAVQARPGAPRVLYVLAALFLALTLVLTYSRASWLVFAGQIVILAGWAAWRRWRKAGAEIAALAGAGLAAVGALALLLLPPVQRGLLTISNVHDYSLQGRLRFWEAALAIIRDHPLLGVGPGAFAYVYPQYQRDWMYYSSDPHSWPLQLICELGLVGVVVLLGIAAGTLWWLRRLWGATGGSAPAALLSVSLLGSLTHCSVDFDYTFGATTALLGVVLALGAHYATAPRAATTQPDGPLRITRWRAGERVLVWSTGLALLSAAAYGQVFTVERFVLDNVRAMPAAPVRVRRELLEQAARYMPCDFRTRFQLASLLAGAGHGSDVGEARREVAACLELNPRYAAAWALEGLLEGPGRGDASIAKAIELDPYNYPEHYFYFATLARTDAERLARLKLGLSRIPIDDPIRPDHIRPQWYYLNPMMVTWYEELVRLSPVPADKALYSRRASAFRTYWDSEQRRQAGGRRVPPQGMGADAG